MSKESESNFIKYNHILGKEASLGPIPANQILFWVGLTLVAYLLTNFFFSLGLAWFFLIALWLIVSWWLLTGKKPYSYLDRWRPPPGADWCKGYKPYVSPIPHWRSPEIQTRCKTPNGCYPLPPRLAADQTTHRNRRFMPFENFVDIQAIVEIKKDNREAAGFLLHKGGHQYQVVFMFALKGPHDILYPAEVAELHQSLEEGLKNLPSGERITFCTGCYSDDQQRQRELEQMADHCINRTVATLLRNEQVKVKQLTERGKRQVWRQHIFVTWTGRDGDQPSNPISGAIKALSYTVQGLFQLGQGLLNQVTGNDRLYQETFFKRLFLRAFQDGFIRWEILLSTRMGLSIRPCSKDELWQWLWNRFNQGEAPPIPQIVTLQESAAGLQLYETVNTSKHFATALIEGQQGNPSCPQHRGYRDLIDLPNRGRHRYCGVVTLEDPPDGWRNSRALLSAVWKLMSTEFVHDTESWVELSPANPLLIRDNLARQAKQSKAASERALLQGQGRDVGAEIKQTESFDAQRKLYSGAKGLHCAPVFLLYRETPEDLELACNTFCNNFGSAVAVRERNIAWSLWLQTLPITTQRLLHGEGGGFGGERRLTPDSETAPGLLPLTVPKDIDSCGVEFITDRGGKPLYIDLFRKQAGRILVTGASGSGKSVLVNQFSLIALGLNIPTVGVDFSSGGNSTFRTAVELLGPQGAFFSLESESSNLLEPPDLRRFSTAVQNQRLTTWAEFLRQAMVAIAMGKIQDPHLETRVNALTTNAIKRFLSDGEIIDRYNQAFKHGWQSEDWRQMPTLHDFSGWFTKPRLGIRQSDPLTDQALVQIRTQIQALLDSKLGHAIGRPSSFSPNPMIKFFTLTGLDNEQDQYLMALNVMAACTRTLLSYPKSLFIGDELSVLLHKAGFAQMVGGLCATGRKEGVSVALLSQDPDTLCTCPTAPQITQNLNYKITGAITPNAAQSFQRYFNYPNLIQANASEQFAANSSELCTYWLIETHGRFWKTRFYPGDMMLASIANNPAEQAARDRILSQYPNTLKGRLEGLAAFTREYIPAMREGAGFDAIGRTVQSPPRHHPSGRLSLVS